MLSIIIPCRKERDISRMVQATRQMFPMAEIIVIEDDEGKGKGWAIRQGIKSAEGDEVVFIDADIDIHPGEIQNLLPYLGYYDVVIGTKKLDRLPPRRKLTSFGYRIFVRLLFRLNISDTQTGLKLWKKDKLPDFESNDFSYDIEMLVRARKAKLRIKEVPINCRIYSKVALSSILQTFVSTLKIWIKNIK